MTAIEMGTTCVAAFGRWRLLGARASVRLLAMALALLASGGLGCSAAVWDAMARGMASANAPAQVPTYATESEAYATPSDHRCPSCNLTMYFTGGTDVEWGKLFKLYKCPVGHAYWYPSTGRQSIASGKDPCPICGMGTYFTGRTRVEWGKLQKIHLCPVGHESVW